MTKRILSASILAVIAVAAVLYYRGHSSDFRLITSVSPWAILALLVLKAAGFLVSGLLLKCVAAAWGVRLSFAQWFGLSRVTHATDLLLPLGGGSMKAIYLKQFHNLSYSAFVTSMALSNFVKIVIVSLVAILCMRFIGKEAAALTLLAVAALSGSLAVLLLAHRFNVGWILRGKRMADFAACWNQARANRSFLLQLGMLHSVAMVFAGTQAWVSFSAFDLDISFKACLVISAFSVMTAVFNLVPGNLGIREAVFAGVSELLGPGVNAGLHAAVLSRALDVLCTLATAPWFARSLAKGNESNRP